MARGVPKARVRPATPALAPLVVGIGASAGGLEAFRTFFGHMPPDSGMAFVLVQHLDPHHKSMLVELIASHTAMQVAEAKDGARVEPNHLYIIPPNATLTLRGRTLRVSKPAPPRESRRPVDTFFESLAEDQGEHAICIVLSGTGSDGTLGVRAIKEHGGLTLAQAWNHSTAMSGMPQSAAATGLVDHIIPVAEMPALLLDYQQHLHRVAPQKDGDGTRRDMPEHVAEICALLRVRSGHDFAGYKISTLLRRIQRRMQVLRIDTVPAFVERLNKEPRQLDLLFREFLISVTQFFRDSGAFETLETVVIPRVLEQKGDHDAIRIWVPACATGEEVYSIAILIREALERQGLQLKVQIFGTDIDDAAVTIARAARYTGKMPGISPQRIERWFIEDGDDLCPVREIREMCIFSTHSAIKDPPFSRLDLISCRNLLIYLEPHLQDRLMQTFHYALRPGGYLCLGQSETIARKTNLFSALDKKNRIFQRRDTATAAPGSMSIPAAARAEPPVARAVQRAMDPVDAEARRIMEKHLPPYVVIDRNHEILRFSGGEIGRYLEPSPGTASLNLLQIVRKSLRPAVRSVVRRAAKGTERPALEHATIKIAGKVHSVTLSAESIDDSSGKDDDYWIVAFQELPFAASATRTRAHSDASHPDVEELEQELQTTKAQLRSTIDELETSVEEMKSANEEYQSVNEELQSSNEELETAKEEMQSVNEELQTINAEMVSKNDQLTHLNSDLKNLLDSTQIPTIFLDSSLHIQRFTPAMTDLFHLREGDRGRPITDLAARMNYSELSQDVDKVLRTLAVVEREVSILERHLFFLMRIRPYRTVDNKVDGVVITFVDITERKHNEATRAQLASIVDSSQDAIIGHHLNGSITSWNSGAQRMFGYSADEIIGESIDVLVPANSPSEEAGILQRVSGGQRIEHFETELLCKDGQPIEVSLSISPIKDHTGQIIAASTIARDFTQRKYSEDQRNLLLAELDHRVKNTLMIISALVAQTIRHTDSPAAFGAIIEGRIQALSRVHNLLNLHDQTHAELRAVVAGELAAFGAGKDGRVVIDDGARVCLTAKATQTLAMAFHELCTNAAKYGALSTAEGAIQISWHVANSAHPPRLKIQWSESGGPPVSPPTRRGFGSQLIERIVHYELQATVQRDFLAAGVHCSIEFPLTDKTGYLMTESTP
ncbi:chemotaxis protein CheB [Povalibacter sp.]|uniref:chemotaxis protein CheB n=1 Tax=Povalibacter sp. TaxID=1962978 RepID=UPI002F421705